MRRLWLLPTAVAVAALGIVAMLAVSATAPAQAKGPTVGSQLVTDLLNPRGMKVGPDGMIYVA